ncbi:Tll0287-like domain-containing protein [Stappia sediminis]|nr:DUF3365 domain-containing protein [Stappia sediminis]
MRRKSFGAVMIAAIAFASFAIPVLASDQELATGERLAAVLRAGRSVISNHQSLINDESIAEKNLPGQRVVDEALELYAQREGKSLEPENLSDLDKQLFEAQIAAMREIVDENQDLIDAEGIGFKGFIPAIFARLVNERFAEKVGNLAQTKVTAPVDIVRNRKATPDEWERNVLESKFQTSAWERGKPYFDEVEKNGKPAFRMLIPEYYSASCLTCHGQPKGEVDVTGYPKEGGAEGDLAGAISITLFR